MNKVYTEERKIKRSLSSCVMKMNRAHSQDQTNIPLIVTTNEIGAKPSSSTATSLDSAFKTKSCRSFVRQSKLSHEHRNKSVPQNLQVCVNFTAILRLSKMGSIHVWKLPSTAVKQKCLFDVLLLIDMLCLFLCSAVTSQAQEKWSSVRLSSDSKKNQIKIENHISTHSNLNLNGLSGDKANLGKEVIISFCSCSSSNPAYPALSARIKPFSSISKHFPALHTFAQSTFRHLLPTLSHVRTSCTCTNISWPFE